MHPVANFIAFQMGWFGSVLGAAHGYPWLGPLLVTGVVVLHLAAVARPQREGILLLTAFLLGAVVDTVFVLLGWLQYGSGQWASWLAPYWIMAMWPLFASTLNVSLRWLRGKNWLGVVMGAVAGPASYLAGASMGAVSLAPGWLPLLGIGAFWAALLPTLVHLATRLDGVSTGPLPDRVSGWMGSA